jgi:hypothetical protein
MRNIALAIAFLFLVSFVVVPFGQRTTTTEAKGPFIFDSSIYSPNLTLYSTGGKKALVWNVTTHRFERTTDSAYIASPYAGRGLLQKYDSLYVDSSIYGTTRQRDSMVNTRQGLRLVPVINTQTGITYSLAASDTGKVVRFTNNSAITLTIPTGLPTGFNCVVLQAGNGVITFTASGTTITNAHSYTKSYAKGAEVTIFCDTTNNFYTQGDMQP